MATKKEKLNSVQRYGEKGRGFLVQGSDQQELSDILNDTKYFVEIGSCDFDTLNDQLATKGWSGVVVEPIKKYLDNLTKRPNVTYINCAVDIKRGQRSMDVFKDEYVNKDKDFAGMTSFSERTLPLNVNKVVKQMIPTITYNDVLSMSKVPCIDYLKIDTEGNDLVILKTIDFNTPQRPRFIKTEHKYCDSIEMRELLESNGYLVYSESSDMYAIDRL